MPSAEKWEYKTIGQPSVDEWLAGDPQLTLQSAAGRSHGQVIDKHGAYMDRALSALGQQGWELVSMWQSQPSQLFGYSVNWLTFKRRLA